MKTDLSPRVRVALYGLLCVLAIPFVFPTWWMVTSSVKPISDIFAFPPDIIPRSFDFSTYGDVFRLQPFAQQYWNSCYIAAIVTVGTMAVSSMAGYAFARIKFPGRSMFFGMMIATLLLPFHVVIIPQYIIFQQLGLVDTYVPLLIGKFLAADAFFVFLMVQFMRNLPAELDEAARIDGAGHVRIFASIMLPLMKPALISTSIFSFIWSWNDFLGPLLYLNTPEKYPLPLALRLFVDQTQSSDYGAMIAMSVLALLPVLVFFLVFQRYIVEGVSTQGLKG